MGAEHRIKLQAHLQSIRDIEDRLSPPTTTAPPETSTCAPPSGNYEVDLLDDNTLETTGQLQMDLAAAGPRLRPNAYHHDPVELRRKRAPLSFLGLARNYHTISHDWQRTQGFEEYGVIHTWYAEQLAYFLSKLASYQEGEGTLLDNTIVFWGSEIGESTQHDLTRMPYMLAGGRNCGLGGGRVIDYSADPQDNNRLLSSLGQVMGAEAMEQFGDVSGATGPLPNLV